MDLNHHIEEFCRHDGTAPDMRNSRLTMLLSQGFIYQGPIHQNGLNCMDILFVRQAPDSAATVASAPAHALPLRCYTREGMPTPSRAASCAAAGLFERRDGSPSPETLHCFTLSGDPVTTTQAHCADAGYRDSPPPPQPAQRLNCYTQAGEAVTVIGESCAAVGLLASLPPPAPAPEAARPTQRHRR